MYWGQPLERGAAGEVDQNDSEQGGDTCRIGAGDKLMAIDDAVKLDLSPAERTVGAAHRGPPRV
jgi:hypothetical protein